MLISCDLKVQPYLEFTHNCAIKKKLQEKASQNLPETLHLVEERSQQRMFCRVPADIKGYGNKQTKQSVQMWWAEKHFRMHNASNLEAVGLRQMARSGSTSVSQEEKAEAAVGTISPKPDSWRMGKRSLVWGTPMLGSQCSANSMIPWTQPALCQWFKLGEVV